MHKCNTHEEWLANIHYMCSCGHVEWAHYGPRENKTLCAHCNCKQYNGETRPLTDHELSKMWTQENQEQAEARMKR